MTPVVLAYALATPRPCCSLVAVWVLAHLHPPPDDPTSDAAWARLDRMAWRRLNVASGDFWSCPAEAARLLGGVVFEGPADLEPGRWHVVQRWRWSATPQGHAYLARREADGYRIVQSSEAHGYRDEIHPDWKLGPGEYRVAVLPEETP